MQSNMRSVFYVKKNYHDYADFYNPQEYVSNETFVLKPEETLLILLDYSDVVSQLNICCGRITPWTKEGQLCMLVKNKSTLNTLRIDKGHRLIHLLSNPIVSSHLCCVPHEDIVKLLNPESKPPPPSLLSSR